MPVTPPTVVDALAARLRTDPSRPLITWYDLDSGARIELSATSWGNWVDKTVNLLGTLGWDDSPIIAAPLVHDHPGHWVSLIWAMATFQGGGELHVFPREQVRHADVVVVGPESASAFPGADTIACSLHPLGLGFDTELPGVTDYSEVQSEPDLHTSNPRGLDEVWYRDGLGSLTGAALTQVPAIEGRKLIRPSSDRSTFMTLVGSLLGGGSVVIVEGDCSEDRLHELAASEHAERIES